jgi:hypothetical protein
MQELVRRVSLAVSMLAAIAYRMLADFRIEQGQLDKGL